MTINLITGVPGSGKTCLSLKLVTDSYFNYDKVHGLFYLKPEFKDLTIITNIDKLTLPHISLDDAMSASNLTFDSFFTVDYQKKISTKYKQIIYIIDEAQRYLSRRLKSPDTVFYFDYHRHLGHDIYLITQDFKKIHYEVSTLIEFEFRLTKRTFSVLGEFRYLIKSSGDIIEQKTFKPPRHIFKLYRSFQAPTTVKTKNIFVKYMFLPILLLFVGGYFLFNILYSSDARADKKQIVQESLLHNQDSVLKTTAFKNEEIKEDLKNDSLEISKDQVQIFPIVNKILLNDNLYAFQDPITNTLVKVSESPYKVLKDKKNYFIAISIKDFILRKKLYDFYNNSGDDKSSIEPAYNPDDSHLTPFSY